MAAGAMTRASLGQALPPALFTPVLGLLGLGLAWRRAAGAYGAAEAVGDLILGAAAGLWLALVALYASKALRRPAVLAEDAAALPGRGGLAAAGVGGLALAAALVPHAPGLAGVLLAAVLLWHLTYVLLVARILLAAPAEARRVTPLWHLIFVGFIIAPAAAVPLGWTLLAQVVLWAMLPVAAFIYAASARQLLTRLPPAPLRPLLAIHLAPLSLGATGAALLGWTVPALVLLMLATGVAATLLASARWLTEAGFLPFWGAFTFPAAAYAGALTFAAPLDDFARLWGIAVLVFASGLIPWIAWRIFRLWPGGRLAQMTGAARA